MIIFICLAPLHTHTHAPTPSISHISTYKHTHLPTQAKKKAQEDAEALVIAEALQKRRDEKEARKKVRMEARLVRQLNLYGSRYLLIFTTTSPVLSFICYFLICFFCLYSSQPSLSLTNSCHLPFPTSSPLQSTSSPSSHLHPNSSPPHPHLPLHLPLLTPLPVNFSRRRQQRPRQRQKQE